MKAKIVFIALLLFASGCALDGFQDIEIISQPAYADNTDTIKIASWNIKWLSHKKAGDPDKGPVITGTIALYDIIAIQEIRDSSEKTMTILQGRLLADGFDYDYKIGPPLPEDSTYRERYAFMFNKDTIEFIEMYTFPDPDDKFVREPLAAHFKAKNGKFDFVIVSIHTQPKKATDEIAALKDAINDAEKEFEESDIITVGDYNADCKKSSEYYDEAQLTVDFPEADYQIIIPNTADTNLASTDCTYDRIIITTSAVEDYEGTWGVYRFDTEHNLTYDKAKKVSDHYPVYATFHINSDTD